MTDSQRSDGGLGGRIAERRQAHGWSQAELGAGIVSTSYVSLVEAGKRVPSQRVLSALAERLGADVGWLRAGRAADEDAAVRTEIAFVELALSVGDVETAAERLVPLRQADLPTELHRRVDAAHARCAELGADLTTAIDVLERQRTDAVRESDAAQLVAASIALCRCYREAGDLNRAIDIGERALEAGVTSAEAELEQAPSLIATLAAAYIERGDLQRAAHLLDRALADDGGPVSRRERGALLWNASIVAADQGRHTDALRLAERASGLFAEDDADVALARLQVLRGWLLLEDPQGDVTSAKQHLVRAQSTLEQAGGQIDLAYLNTELSRASLALGEPADAEGYARASLTVLGATAGLERARAGIALARALRALGSYDDSVMAMTTAAAELNNLGAGRQSAQAWRELAELHTDVGDPVSAADCFRRALDATGIREPLRGSRQLSRPPTS